MYNKVNIRKKLYICLKNKGEGPVTKFSKIIYCVMFKEILNNINE